MNRQTFSHSQPDAIQPDAIYDVLVIGAGISGLAARRRLLRAGQRVLLVEKSRGAGGRMSTRRMGDARADLGAQFASARSTEWLELLKSADSSSVLSIQLPHDSQHPRFVHRDGMSSVAKLLLETPSSEAENPIEFSHRANRLEWLLDSHGKPIWRVSLEASGHGLTRATARALIVTCPVPQTLALLDASELELEPEKSARLREINYHPCLTLVVVLEKETSLSAPGILKWPNQHLNGIFEQKKKGVNSHVPVLVVHASSALSRKLWDEAEPPIIDRIWSEALEVLRQNGVNDALVRERQLHRWRYCEPEKLLPEACHEVRFKDILSPMAPILLAGDAFAGLPDLKKPAIEGAFLSGEAAARALLARIARSYELL